MVHLAETEAQARKDVEFGIVDWFRYFQRVAAFPQMALPGETVDEMVDFVNDNGLGVVGTPDMLVELLRSWDAQSGGFGVCLIMHHDWADDAAVRRSHELLARFVMPEVQGHADRLRSRRDAAIASRQNLADKALAAVQAATDSYAKEATA
jgi:limonene 1,2-monooxygenase